MTTTTDTTTDDLDHVAAKLSGHTTSWDRQVGESSKAFAAFRAYRDLPPVDRVLLKAGQAVGISERQCRRWASAHDWRERSAAWDDHLAKVEDQERLADIRTMHSNHRRAGRTAMLKAVQALTILEPENIPASAAARLLELGARLERSTLTVSVRHLQGLDDIDDDDDPWDVIARALIPE